MKVKNENKINPPCRCGYDGYEYGYSDGYKYLYPYLYPEYPYLHTQRVTLTHVQHYAQQGQKTGLVLVIHDIFKLSPKML